jgi:hypothetical protein
MRSILWETIGTITVPVRGQLPTPTVVSHQIRCPNVLSANGIDIGEAPDSSGKH